MSVTIPYINQESLDTVPAGALKLSVSNNNWKDQFPYTPEVDSFLWHDGENLNIRYEVKEDYVAALAQKDNESVCKDACVEFFISFDDGGYYNIEANCGGIILMSHRKGRKIDVRYAPLELLSGIKRISSLGETPFACKKITDKWHLTLKIPKACFFQHNFKSLKGIKAKCNIYKCGDNLPHPHFLSWNPVLTEQPDFHRPEFFAPIDFE